MWTYGVALEGINGEIAGRAVAAWVVIELGRWLRLGAVPACPAPAALGFGGRLERWSPRAGGANVCPAALGQMTDYGDGPPGAVGLIPVALTTKSARPLAYRSARCSSSRRQN